MAPLSLQTTPPLPRAVGALAVSIVTAGIASPGTHLWMALVTMVASLILGQGPHALQRIAIGIALGALGSCVAALVGWQDWQEGARELLFCSTWVGLPGLAGLTWRLRGQVRRQAAERILQERRARQAAQRRRHDAERLALAESLHDDLGHALSLVALNLGRLELAGHLERDVKETVAMARRQLSAAVEHLGASVSALRESSTSRLSIPGEDDAAVLIGTARAAGGEVDVIGATRLDQLDPYDRVTVSRVVKEALTNAVKHAPRQPITLTLDGDAEFLRLIAENPLPRCQVDPLGGSGSGLGALSTHFETVGGTLTVLADDDTFRLEAVIPASGRVRDAHNESNESEKHERDPLDVARRKNRLILAGSLATAVAMLVSVEAFTRFEVHRSVLPEADFRRIQLGDVHAHTEHHLPSHELLPRPQAPEGTDCHDYAVSFDWLGGPSGDIHRVCFTGGIVTGTQRLDGRNR